MIDITSLSTDWLTKRRSTYRNDPSLMESMIHALYLLEQLKLTGLDFIFKGGTSLVLLMEQPKRFSVDIDIIVHPSVNRQYLESYLAKIVETSAFIRMELDERRSYQIGIPKAHYKFIFNSTQATKSKERTVITNPEREILLDILFAENHYPALIERPIQTEWLMQIGDPLTVSTPDINSITGDKLTAFAPNTTGILYGKGKEKEIIKQLFDVGCLFDLLTDLEIFRASFIESAETEIKYRAERNITSTILVLQDTIDTAALIARIDMQNSNEEKAKIEEIKKGINQFGHFVFFGKFRILEAQVASAKAAYLAAIILSNYKGELKRFNDKTPQTEFMITDPEYNFLNKRLKFVAKGEALYYWFQAIKLLKSK